MPEGHNSPSTAATTNLVDDHRPEISPGTLVAPAGAVPSTVSATAYGPDRIEDVADLSVADIPTLRQRAAVIWVNVTGLGSVETVKSLGEIFALHPLALEDTLHLGQRPKTEDYGNHLFLVSRMVVLGDSLRGEQVTIFVGDGFVITFQERSGDVLDPIRKRLRNSRGRLRANGADYLAYAIVDAIVDGFFPVLEAYGDRLEHVEDMVAHGGGGRMLADLQQVKRDLRRLRRVIAPQGEAISLLLREPHHLVHDNTMLFLRDSEDHVTRVLDMLESYKDWSGDLTDYFLSTTSHRMNEIMRVLTVIATIFIPLTFIAGIYGMNFDTSHPWNMPELAWPFAYPVALTAMGGLAAALLILFKRRGWIGSPDVEPS